MTELSEEDRKLLRHAAIHAAIVGGKEPPTKRILHRLLEPTVLVALITVLGGGIFGTLITSSLQRRAKERDIVVADFSSTNEARLRVASEAYDLIGSVVASADDLIMTTRADFAQARDERTQRQVQELLISYNTGEKNWRARHARTSLLLAYHHDSTIRNIGWPPLASAVSDYVDCAHRWRSRNASGVTDVSRVCTTQRAVVDGAVEGLSEKLLTARHELLTKQLALKPK